MIDETKVEIETEVLNPSDPNKFSLFWNGINPIIKYSNLCKNHENGCLMWTNVDILSKVISLQCSGIRQL